MRLPPGLDLPQTPLSSVVPRRIKYRFAGVLALWPAEHFFCKQKEHGLFQYCSGLLNLILYIGLCSCYVFSG